MPPHGTEAPASARAQVTERVAHLAVQWPDLDFAPTAWSGLDARDEAFAQQLLQQVVRRWRTLEALVVPFLRQPFAAVEPRVRAVLMVGAAQLAFMDRVPAFAAIDESVEWAKRRVRPGAGGLVNAVLRKVASLCAERLPPTGAAWPGGHEWWNRRDLVPLEDGGALRLSDSVLPEEALPRVAVQTSHAEALLTGWTAAAGWQEALRRAAHSLVHPPIILAGTGAPPQCRPHQEAGHHLWDGTIAELRSLLGATPGLRVQDPGSGAAVARTAGLRPRVVVDACAGRGTKTRQLALLHPDAEVLAWEPEETRAEALRGTAGGHANVRVAAPGQLVTVAGRVDLLVLDAPCTNTGVLPRRPEAKGRFDPRRLAGMVARQQAVAREYLPLLAPGGALLWITCSLEPAENEGMAEWLRARVGTAGALERRTPSGTPGTDPAEYADGGASVLFVKCGRG